MKQYQSPVLEMGDVDSDVIAVSVTVTPSDVTNGDNYD